MTNAETVLELREVTKVYDTTPPTTVLHGVNLRVQAGELVGIVGPSGSGKSTLLNVIGTLDAPTSGEVWVAGHDTAQLSDKELSALRSRELGFVFQQFFLLGGMSAMDNVGDGMLYTGESRAQRRIAAAEALERVGLGHRLDHHPNQMSGGERQRVAIARALVAKPSLLLADEPTGNLDSRSSDGIMNLMEDLNREGSTILVITHDHEIASHLPRQVAVRDGLIERDSATAGVTS